jgi:hypothetical protein
MLPGNRSEPRENLFQEPHILSSRCGILLVPSLQPWVGGALGQVLLDGMLLIETLKRGPKSAFQGVGVGIGKAIQR